MTLMNTRITELFGIRVPIVQVGSSTAAMPAEDAAAISEAGALGMLSLVAQPTPVALAQEIERCRRRTARPFGISLVTAGAAAPVEPYLDVVIDSGIQVLETGGELPPIAIEKLKRHRVRILHRCTSLRAALSAERSGVDAIAIADHAGIDRTGDDARHGFALIADAARALRIPVVACGLDMDGSGMAAALALGAEGVGMELRFRENAGATSGLPACDELLQRIEDECRAALGRASRLVQSGSPIAASA
jgi:NADH:quinone reductase (non-electrogenic)